MKRFKYILCTKFNFLKNISYEKNVDKSSTYSTQKKQEKLKYAFYKM